MCAADLHWAIFGGDLLVGNVVPALLLQSVGHADQEVCGEEVHAHIAPSIPQLPCACTGGYVRRWVSHTASESLKETTAFVTLCS